MSKLEEFKDVKLLKRDELTKLNLPEELIEYLSESQRYEGKLYEPILKDIEELFLYYSSFYDFSFMEFSKSALVAINRANSVDKFYFYMKKIIDKSIELIPKDKENTSLNLSEEGLMELIEDVRKRYFNIIDVMYEGHEVDLFHVGKRFGELELVLKLRHDDLSSDLLKYGKKVLENYLQESKGEAEQVIEESQTETL